MVRFADLKMAVDSVRSKLMNTQHRTLREEQRVVEENYPNAKADLKEQTAKLTAAEEGKTQIKLCLIIYFDVETSFNPILIKHRRWSETSRPTR